MGKRTRKNTENYLNFRPLNFQRMREKTAFTFGDYDRTCLLTSDLLRLLITPKYSFVIKVLKGTKKSLRKTFTITSNRTFFSTFFLKSCSAVKDPGGHLYTSWRREMERGRLFFLLTFLFKISKNKGLDTNRNKWI